MAPPPEISQVCSWISLLADRSLLGLELGLVMVSLGLGLVRLELGRGRLRLVPTWADQSVDTSVRTSPPCAIS